MEVKQGLWIHTTLRSVAGVPVQGQLGTAVYTLLGEAASAGCKIFV